MTYEEKHNLVLKPLEGMSKQQTLQTFEKVMSLIKGKVSPEVLHRVYRVFWVKS